MKGKIPSVADLKMEKNSRFNTSNLFLGAFLLIGMIGCNHTSADKSHIYRILKNRQIIKTTFQRPNDSTKINNYSIVEGNNLVFSFNHIPQTSQEEPDSRSESIVFQVDPNLSSFRYKNAQIDSINGYYMQDSDTLIQKSIEKGLITGKKMSDSTWNVRMSIKVPTGKGLIDKKIDHTFTIQKIK